MLPPSTNIDTTLEIDEIIFGFVLVAGLLGKTANTGEN